MKRVILFWDFSNFKATVGNLTCQEKTPKFAYNKLAQELAGGNDLIKIYFVCSYEEDEDELKGFYNSLDYIPYFYIKSFERKSLGNGKSKPEKQVDVYLATQMVALAYENAYDIAYLVSGDEDFVPAVETVQQKGKIVVAVSARKQMSRLLQRRCDRYILIDDNEQFKPFYFENFVKES